MVENNNNYGINLCSRVGDTLNTILLPHYQMFVCKKCTMQNTETGESGGLKIYKGTLEGGAEHVYCLLSCPQRRRGEGGGCIPSVQDPLLPSLQRMFKEVQKKPTAPPPPPPQTPPPLPPPPSTDTPILYRAH